MGGVARESVSGNNYHCSPCARGWMLSIFGISNVRPVTVPPCVRGCVLCAAFQIFKNGFLINPLLKTIIKTGTYYNSNFGSNYHKNLLNYHKNLLNYHKNLYNITL